jgi:hypothetical protein
MTSYPPPRSGRGLPARAVLAAGALALAGVAAAPAVSQAATMTTLYASPTGSGTACTSAAPCSLTQAKSSVEASAGSMSGDIVVQLAGGTYRLSAPLVFNNADSGTNGHNIIFQAAPGATPVISGGQQVTGWTLHDSGKNIYSAAVPVGTDSRQLYVDGAEAPRAAISINRSDVSMNYTGMTINNSALNYLSGLPEQNRIELESQNSFTDHFAPVQSISGTTITMQQPSWNNNNWGYDTLYKPFAGGQMFLENSYSFLQGGQWYLDPQAGQLYYRAPSGWNPSSHDVELPQLTSLVDISGNSVDNPVHNIAFQGITFSHATWMAPSSNIGYADQQSGTFFNKAYQQPSDFLTSCQSGCTLFEATRESLGEAPAAVQVSAAGSISFTGDTFTHLGEVGLGIGQDNNAVASGVGLGASSITADHNVFTDDAGAAVVVGGTQTNAHHPSDTAMTNQNITVTNNQVNGVAEDYKDMAGILSTYVTHAVIDHNEVQNLPYDGIDIGWGWGMNDAGGSNDYANRGTYNYQPRYSTATTLKNTDASYNKIHATKKIFHDGGSLYNLSANPSSTFNNNYIYDNHNSVGLYLDEGSRYVTLTNNVLQDNGVWAFTNANGSNNTSDNAFNYNWYNAGATQVATGSPHNNTLTGNTQVSGTNWPSGAQSVINQSGVGASNSGNTVTVTSPGNQSGAVGTPVTSVQVQASDSAGGQTLTFSATGLPPGLSISGSGLISGTPTSGGTYSPVVTAKDTTGASGSASFTWSISGGTGGSTGPLHAVGAGRCLDDPNSTTTLATQMQIYDCNGGAGQTWTHTSTGALSITVGGQTLCLDANGKGTTNGTKAIIYNCNGQTNQQWNINSNGTITGVMSGLCLDVTGAGTANGSLVELWACNGGSNQQWKLG